MNIIKLEAENFKKLKAIRIEPDGSAVIVGGDNEAGKSSVLDSIKAALGGVRNCPLEPIRRGSQKSEIILETEDLIVRRTFTKKSSQIEVTAKVDGQKFSSPQSMLDKLIGDLSFDPNEFQRMKPREQSEIVRKIAGLEFSDLDSQRAIAYDRRADLARAMKLVDARIGPVSTEPRPEKLIVVSEAMAELDRCRIVNAGNNQERSKLEAMRDRIRDLERQKQQALAAEDALYVKVAETKKDVEKIQADIDRTTREGVSAAEAVKALIDENENEAREVIANAENSNREYASGLDRDKNVKESAALTEKHKKANREIENIDARKATAIQNAEYPLDGMTVSYDGVLLDGIPLEQSSGAQRLRCAVAMGLALNPDLKVMLIHDGSLLDEKSLAIVVEMAKEAGAQVWIEKVGDGSECTVVIEDGEIRG